MKENHNFGDTQLFGINMNFCIMFVGIIHGKPSRDFTRSLGSPRSLKGLLHTLKAIVFTTTEEVEKILF
jgi:hypothetical protein